jgi:hypothetical protein
LLAEYPDEVRVVFKHNPLGFHKRAMPIAKATMAAHMQGKFWEFHDLVFERKAYDDAKLEVIATELGLDVAKWKTDQALPAVEAKILHDQASMVGHGARGTPACFFNGKLVSGAKPYDAFKAEIDTAIKEADALIAAGTKLEDVHAKLAEKNAKKSFVDAVIMGGTPPKPPPPKPRKPKQDPTKQVQIDLHKDDPSMGPKKAQIVLATFSDFQ